MQKRSLLSIFSVSAVTTLIIVIVIMGTFNIAILVEDIDEAEDLFEISNQFFEEDLQIIFDDLAKVPDNNYISFYSNVNRYLDITINYLNRHTNIFDNGKLDGNYELKTSLNVIPDHFYGDYFIVNNAGDIILDETGFLEGNLLDIVDDSGDRVFGSDISLEDLRNINFSSSWLNNQEQTIYYASLKKLNDDYDIGLMTSRADAIETYKQMYIEHLNNISNFDSATYVVYNLSGEKVLGAFELPKSTVQEYIENRSIRALNRVEHEQFGILQYQVFPELDWLVIHQDNQLNQLRLLTRKEGDVRTKQLMWMFHLIFSLLVVVFVSFTVLSKRVRKKLDNQINTLNDSYINGKLVSDDDILFDEFGKVVQIFNRITKMKTSGTPNIEKPVKNDFDKAYLIKTIKSFLVDTYLDKSSEEFELKELITIALENMNIETSDFNVDIICDQEIVMFQNKLLIEGIMKFFVSNLIMNSGHLPNNMITIEIVADDNEVNISFTRNIIKKYESHADIVFNIFEELDEEIMSSLNGRLDYSNYEQSDRKLVIHCPLVK